MIFYLKGYVKEIKDSYCIIDVNGIGYKVTCPKRCLNTFKSHIQSYETTIYIHEDIRENSYSLYGFEDLEIKEFFELLLSVGGVGPNTALLILSEHYFENVIEFIIHSDYREFEKIKGIGKKTAKLIVSELQKKINKVQYGS